LEYSRFRDLETTQAFSPKTGAAQADWAWYYTKSPGRAVQWGPRRRGL